MDTDKMADGDGKGIIADSSDFSDDRMDILGGIKMFWCERCNQAIDPVYEKWEEYHSEVEAYERKTLAVCPRCGEYVDEARRCVCGEWINPAHYYCSDCLEYGREIVNESVQKIISREKTYNENDALDLINHCTVYW